MCRAWNYRESDEGKITQETQNIYLLLEGLEHAAQEEMVAALNELQALLALYCGGSYTHYFLDKNNVEAVIGVD